MAGYHSKDIARGTYGELSKITEEHEELLDAAQQGNRIMVLCELCDMVGAIEAYAQKHHNIGLDEIITMKDATKRAFEDGTRAPRIETGIDPVTAAKIKRSLATTDSIANLLPPEPGSISRSLKQFFNKVWNW